MKFLFFFLFFSFPHNTKKNIMEPENIEFVNELGNKININASVEKDNEKDVVLVKYEMSGPTSVMSNTITWQEAKILVNMLKTVMNKHDYKIQT